MSENAEELAGEAGGSALVKVVVGRLGRSHGVRGAIGVRLATDEPTRRFQPGSKLWASGPVRAASVPAGKWLTVESARQHGSRFVVTFVGVVDREAAAELSGLTLEAEVSLIETPSGPDEYFDRTLIGLSVVSEPDNELIGQVEEVLHMPGQDLLAVRSGDGSELLIPFVKEIVLDIDLAAGLIRADLPTGLLG